ncbi:MAG: replication-associated recombination protein A [Saprospiraceae bacterium]|nr:replication-associated recombination protein A [Saprospiraceae bacterium]
MISRNEPLAERMRPKSLDDYVGQEHLVGKGAILRKVIESGSMPSFILWGPPGVGKTTLASVIAHTLERPFQSLSAINSGVKDIRDAIETAKSQKFFSRPNPVLFIDEIHRFSKSQQDSLLGAVEKGIVTLIGATTENPSFEVISALLSRCQVYILKPLERHHLIQMIDNAVAKNEYLKNLTIKIESYDALIALSGGDGRKLYNCLELVVNQFAKDEEIIITDALVTTVIQQNLAKYDKAGEQHYDIISAFIKSMRASDPNASVYYLARMIAGGEDPLFICRRMIILASEDIGLANPNALLLANNCFQAVHHIGMPEGRIIMSQTAIYLACSPKSNASYVAINQALDLVKQTGDVSVPLHLRNAPTNLMKDIGYGTGYQYAHDYQGNFSEMECLPETLAGTKLYSPGHNAAEVKYSEYLKLIWKGKYGY